MNQPRTGWWALAGISAVLAAGVLGGWTDLWSSNGKPAAPALVPVAQAAVPNEPVSLQDAFMGIAERVGPAVVSISTEQIDRVKQYFRFHPFMGDQEPFEDFFRQFYGDLPEREMRRFGLGSGVIIDPAGYILTNEHVVADAEKISVSLSDGREFTGTVKGKDQRSDLAIVKIDAKNLPVVQLGDSELARTGQWVVALGNPLGIGGVGMGGTAIGTEPTLSVGVVSALHRQLPRTSKADRDYSDLIQTDATINPGNSGGPLVNLAGEVIGVNVAIIVGPGNAYGFAIPVNKAKRILENLIEGKKILYGWLGIEIQEVTPDVAEYYGLKEAKGVLVYRVVPNGPAAKAGLKDGDIVRAFEGKPIMHTRELIERVSGTPVGQQVTVELLREGKPVSMPVAIGERPTEFGEGEDAPSESWRGLKVMPMTAEMAQQFELPPQATGVVVAEIADDSPAATSGLREGDIINEINRVRIEDLDDYQQVVSQVKGNALVRTNRGYVVIKEAP